MSQNASRTDRPVTEMPAYWFLLLEHAREGVDLQGEAQAQRELARLGVEVSYVTRRLCQEVSHGQ